MMFKEGMERRVIYKSYASKKYTVHGENTVPPDINLMILYFPFISSFLNRQLIKFLELLNLYHDVFQ